jgi:hypothetical protein
MIAEGMIEKLSTHSTDEKPTRYRATITAVGTKEEIDFFMKQAFRTDSDIHKVMEEL